MGEAEEVSPFDLSRYQNRLGLKNKLGRLLWGMVWMVLFRPSPRLLHGWRRFLLRSFGAKIGNGVRLGASLKVWAPWNLEVGDHCWLADGVDCYCVEKVVLEADVVVSQRAFLCTASHDVNDPGFSLITKPIILNSGSWVAAEAFVGPGVTVGRGGVVAARAVVVKDVKAESIVAGNPARFVKKRTLRIT